MKTYVRPVMEYIELRVEESLACFASSPIYPGDDYGNNGNGNDNGRGRGNGKGNNSGGNNGNGNGNGRGR